MLAIVHLSNYEPEDAVSLNMEFYLGFEQSPEWLQGLPLSEPDV